MASQTGRKILHDFTYMRRFPVLSLNTHTHTDTDTHTHFQSEDKISPGDVIYMVNIVSNTVCTLESCKESRSQKQNQNKPTTKKRHRIVPTFS